MAGKAWQIMECLDVGDAVSNIAMRNARILGEMGHSDRILTIFCADGAKEWSVPAHEVNLTEDDVALFHFWNLSRMEKWLQVCPARKILYYHNITPPEFFPEGSDARASIQDGYDQLERILPLFDAFIGDSEYNVRQLYDMGYPQVPGLAVPPVVDREQFAPPEYEEALLEKLKSEAEVNFLFLGRIAPNKRQTDIVRVFDYYYTYINRNSRLHLVGNDGAVPDYTRELHSVIAASNAAGNIHVPGKVTDAEMGSYFRAADLFLCMSEHEGFCVPLVMAMAYGVPVLAYAEAAVPETLGDSGALVTTKDPALVAELTHVLLSEPGLRDQCVERQMRRLDAFTAGEARRRLEAILHCVEHGKPGSQPFWMNGNKNPRREEKKSQHVSVA